MAEADTQRGHEVIYFLTHLQERDGAEEPDKDVAGDGLFALFGNLLLHFFIRKGESCGCEQSSCTEHEQYNQKDFPGTLHGDHPFREQAGWRENWRSWR